MIDPSNITNYNQTTAQLQEFLLFWVCAAGKAGKTAARCLNNFLNGFDMPDKTPFERIKTLTTEELAVILKFYGIGCYTSKSATMMELATSDLDLHTCSMRDLELVYGIGMKTSRCFIIHSRADANCAGLDTHILKFLRLMGHDTPKSTPIGKKYLQLEKEFVILARKYKKTVATLDLEIWNHYSIGD